MLANFSNAHVAFGRFQPAYAASAFLERAFASPSIIGTLTTLPAVSFSITQIGHPSETALPRLPISAIPTPPPAIYYGRTQLLNL